MRFKKGFSNLKLEGQGWGIIMGVTRLLLLGQFYTIQTKRDQTFWRGVYQTFQFLKLSHAWHLSSISYEVTYRCGWLFAIYQVISLPFSISTLSAHTACISFWITKTQAISTDNGFVIEKIEIKRKEKSHKPFKSYLLTGQANSAKKAG